MGILPSVFPKRVKNGTDSLPMNCMHYVILYSSCYLASITMGKQEAKNLIFHLNEMGKVLFLLRNLGAVFIQKIYRNTGS